MKTLLVKTEGAGLPENLALFVNPQNGRVQLGFLAADGSCAAPIADLEPQGGKFQLLLLNSPQGPCALASDGKIVVSR